MFRRNQNEEAHLGRSLYFGLRGCRFGAELEYGGDHQQEHKQVDHYD